MDIESVREKVVSLLQCALYSGHRDSSLALLTLLGMSSSRRTVMTFCHIPLQPADDPRAEQLPGMWEFAKFGMMLPMEAHPVKLTRGSIIPAESLMTSWRLSQGMTAAWDSS